MFKYVGLVDKERRYNEEGEDGSASETGISGC
jgi:hypothetical protein